MRNMSLLVSIFFWTTIFGQITYSKDAWGNTIAKDQTGRTIATYSEDAWGNTEKKDKNGNVEGKYSKDAWGNTVYTQNNFGNKQTNISELSVSKYKPMSFDEILELQQLKNNEKGKHDYVLKVINFVDEKWIEYKTRYDNKLLVEFLSVLKIRETMIERYKVSNNVNESVNYATQIYNNLSLAINKFNNRKIEMNLKKAQVIEYYNSLKPYLKNINDGWHNVMAIDNSELCETRKVYVTNNSIITYLNGSGNSFKFNYGKIIDGKSMIETINNEGDKNVIDIYFIEVL
jgi:hypothetical protein